jgi:hypothetical protein
MAPSWALGFEIVQGFSIETAEETFFLVVSLLQEAGVHLSYSYLLHELGTPFREVGTESSNLLIDSFFCLSLCTPKMGCL